MIQNSWIVNLTERANPGFIQRLSRGSKLSFDEKSYEALNEFPEGRDKALGLMLMCTIQKVLPYHYRDAVEQLKVIQKTGFEYGDILQVNRSGRTLPESPVAYGEDGKGLAPGELMTKHLMNRPGVVIQDYFAKNFDFYTHISWDNFDVKGAWLKNDGGLELLFGQVLTSCKASYAETEFAEALEITHLALTSVTHPLRATQKVEIAFSPKKDKFHSFKNLVDTVNNFALGLQGVPTYYAGNAAGASQSLDINDYVLWIRKEYVQDFNTVFSGVFHDDKLKLAIKDVVPVPNFGGIMGADAEGNIMQRVYTDPYVVDGVSYGDGSPVGWISADVTVNGRAKYVNGQWLVNVTSGATTADTTFYVDDSTGFPTTPTIYDPHKDTIALIMEKGVIHELFTEEMKVESKYIEVYRRTQTFFERYKSGMKYMHTFGLIAINKQDIELDLGDGVTVAENATYDVAANSDLVVDGETIALNTLPLGTVEYEISNPSVATVNSFGIVTGVDAGSAILKVAVDYDGFKFADTVAVTVTE